MTESLQRLAWALPLVLLLGLGAILVLRRWPGLAKRSSAPSAPIAVRHSAVLSERATAHLLEVAGRRMLVVETPTALDIVELDMPRNVVRGARRWQG